MDYTRYKAATCNTKSNWRWFFNFLTWQQFLCFARKKLAMNMDINGDVLLVVQSTIVGILINQSNQPLCACIYPILSHVFKQIPTCVAFDGQKYIMLQLVRLSLNSCLTIVFWSLKSPILCAWWLAQGFPPMACYRCSTYVPSGKHAQSYCTWPFIVDLPIKNGDFPIFSIVMLVYQRVTIPIAACNIWSNQVCGDAAAGFCHDSCNTSSSSVFSSSSTVSIATS